MPISDTPKKIEFIIMKHSAAELVKANNVALMVSAENYIIYAIYYLPHP
jgi:hypothetical protein